MVKNASSHPFSLDFNRYIRDHHILSPSCSVMGRPLFGVRLPASQCPDVPRNQCIHSNIHPLLIPNRFFLCPSYLSFSGRVKLPSHVRFLGLSCSSAAHFASCPGELWSVRDHYSLQVILWCLPACSSQEGTVNDCE